MKNQEVVIGYENLLIADALHAFLAEDNVYSLSGKFLTHDILKDLPSAFLRANIVLLEFNEVSAAHLPLVKDILAKNSDASIVLFADPGNGNLVHQFLDYDRVKAFLRRSCTSKALVMRVLNEIHNQNSFYCCPSVTKRLLDEYNNQITSKIQDTLTEREFQILRYLAMELSTPQIANELFLSPSTVKTHRRNIMRKMGVSNVLALLRTAKDLGLITRHDMPLCRSCKQPVEQPELCF